MGHCKISCNGSYKKLTNLPSPKLPKHVGRSPWGPDLEHRQDDAFATTALVGLAPPLALKKNKVNWNRILMKYTSCYLLSKGENSLYGMYIIFYEVIDLSLVLSGGFLWAK